MNLKKIAYTTCFIVFLLALLVGCNKQEINSPNTSSSNLKLWYDKPAELIKDKPYHTGDDPEWLKALPLGNGSLGAMVFGNVNKERIQLNEESMWSGSPADNDNPQASRAQDKIRQLLFDENYKDATALTNKTQVAKGEGSGHGEGAKTPFGSFQTLGDLWIEKTDKQPYKNYYKELNLENATALIKYEQNEVNYKRQVFISHPDQALVVQFTADTPKSISFTCSLSRPERFETAIVDNQLVMTGALYDGKGGEGLEYMTRLKAKSINGKVSYKDSKITVTNADTVTLYLTASTNYLLEDPTYLGRNHKEKTRQHLEEALNKKFDTLLNRHITEYQKFFKRVTFDITPNKIQPIPTDERLKKYEVSKNDPHLEELMFQYGRYLLISSSRPGTLPANLQGIWSNKIQSPWNGDYHTDVNLQMNYWPAEVTNLPEMHLPLFKFTKSLVAPGMKTAKVQYNNNGWVLHPITNVWGYTSPGESASWGMHTTGGAWLATHIWQHYLFTQDLVFLKEMYSVLEGSVNFYMDWLVADPVTGKLVSGPAVSPENTFIAPDGSLSQISMGPAHDQQVIWQLFSDFINASEQLGIENDFITKVIDTKAQLAKSKIGSDGRLMEWNKEFEETEPGHRHISHLFGVHPGSQFYQESDAQLVEAAKKSLEYRLANGGGHTGWSAAWLISQYARLKNGKKAKENLETVLSKSTSPNLFGQHPPFQIDANFGTTAGIAEMLLQSHAETVALLPALPKSWKTGVVSGLRARGGIIIDIKWKNNTLLYANIKALVERDINVEYKETVRKIHLTKNETYQLVLEDFNAIQRP